MTVNKKEELVENNQNRLSSYNILTRETLQTQRLLKQSSSDPVYKLLKDCHTVIIGNMMDGKGRSFLPLVNHKIINHFKDCSVSDDKVLLLRTRSINNMKLQFGSITEITPKMAGFISYMSVMPLLSDLYVLKSNGIIDYWFVLKGYTSEINREYTSRYLTYTFENGIDDYEIMILDEEELVVNEMPEYIFHFITND